MNNDTRKDMIYEAFQTKLPKLVEAVLPAGVPASRFLRSAFTAYQAVPSLARCSQLSFIAAVVQAAQLNLEVGTALGHAWILPYKGAAKLTVGYKGYLALARRGSCEDIKARLVYADDTFDFSDGSDPYVVHKRALGPREGVELLGGYLCAWLKGTPRVTPFWLPLADIMKRRNVSQGYLNDPATSPWTLWFDEMATKTVIRAGVVQLPMDDYLAAAVELDNRYELGVQSASDLLDNTAATEAAMEERQAAQTEQVRARVNAKQRALPPGPAQPIPTNRRRKVATPVAPDREWEQEVARQRAEDAALGEEGAR